MVENIVGGKGDNAGYQHCLLFPQCFQKASSPSAWRVGIVWKSSMVTEQILDQTNLKAFAENRLDFSQMTIPVFDRVKIIVGKGENAGL